MQIEQIIIDCADEKQMQQCERKKTRLENAGFNLVSEREHYPSAWKVTLEYKKD